MLSVAVGGLVEIHEIHVNLVVGNLFIILGGKMAVRLLQGRKAVDPHLAGRESVAPGHDAAALVGVICFFDNVGDTLAGNADSLEYQRIRELFAHLLRHFLGSCLDGLQHFWAVKELRADYKPEFTCFQLYILLSLFFGNNIFFCKLINDRAGGILNECHPNECYGNKKDRHENSGNEDRRSNDGSDKRGSCRIHRAQ